MFRGVEVSKILWNVFPCRVCWHLRSEVFCTSFTCLLNFWDFETNWTRLLFIPCIFSVNAENCRCVTFLNCFSCVISWSWSGKFRAPYFSAHLCHNWRAFIQGERSRLKRTKTIQFDIYRNKISFKCSQAKHDHDVNYLQRNNFVLKSEYFRSFLNLAWVQKITDSRSGNHLFHHKLETLFTINCFSQWLCPKLEHTVKTENRFQTNKWFLFQKKRKQTFCRTQEWLPGILLRYCPKYLTNI